MLALRAECIACNDRWEEAWPQITGELRRQATQHRTELRQKRKTRCEELPALMETTTVAEKTIPVSPVAEIAIAPTSLSGPAISSAPATKEPHRPAANHLWRHMPIGRARFQPPAKHPSAKP